MDFAQDGELDNEDSASHVGMGGKGLRCMRCGTEEELPYNACGTSVLEKEGGRFVERWIPSRGISLEVLEAYVNAFSSNHAGCSAEDPRGKARFDYSTPEEWKSSWDTGLSAFAIYAAFRGKDVRQLLRTPGCLLPIPRDPSDFGRCYRLLKIAPGWAAQLERVTETHPCWAPFVAAWPDLSALYEEELPSGECPKLYEAMEALVNEAKAL